ncbi:hdaC, FYVE-type zinc finger-containing protein [Tieghemostelium lacteum]|uniref:HdaC, FYVE-type zinc finger-containing protein n=1 Tax=Tieghemostelium lacteum TaxID=361077 RepID=A0A152A3I6_TIELA|nr:hdaC, FYVE-type zinc finger-containing protein [Tieghemostelium lacteum]|eukprot:KYR00611.1 hdaC, FYVE-type zinc finger-containing protein [Tieghemostelium lacteum]
MNNKIPQPDNVNKPYTAKWSLKKNSIEVTSGNDDTNPRSHKKTKIEEENEEYLNPSFTMNVASPNSTSNNSQSNVKVGSPMSLGSANADNKPLTINIVNPNEPLKPKRLEKKQIQLEQYINAIQKPQTPNVNTTTTTTTTTGTTSLTGGFDSDSHDEDGGMSSNEGETEDKKKKKSNNNNNNNSSHSNSIIGDGDIRPCWFTGCVKADRSLKILRPCLVPSCKTHGHRSEEKMLDGLKNNTFQISELNRKDKICAVCGEGKQLYYCSSQECAFGFCKSCTDFVAIKHGRHPSEFSAQNPWLCWVCTTSKQKGKERERTKWVRTQVPSLSGQRGGGSTPGGSNVEVIELGSMDQDLSSYKDEKRIRKNRNLLPVQDTRKYTKRKSMDENSLQQQQQQTGISDNVNSPTSRPSSPTQQQYPHQQQQQQSTSSSSGQYPPLPHHIHQKAEDEYVSLFAPDKEPISAFDYFIDKSYSFLRYLTTLEPPLQDDLYENITMFVDRATKLKTVRFEIEYDLVWRMIERLGELFQSNLIATQNLLEMHKHINLIEKEVTEQYPNDPYAVERLDSVLFEHHNTIDELDKQCYCARNAIYCSIELVYRFIGQYKNEYEAVKLEEAQREKTCKSNIEIIERKMKASAIEVQKLKTQEENILSSLSKVRSALIANESFRDALNKKVNDLKVQIALSANQLQEKKADVDFKTATLETEISTMNVLTRVTEGVYWAHDYFYDIKVGQAEKLITQRLHYTQNQIKFFGPEKAKNNSLIPYNTQFPSVDNPIFKTIAIYHKTCMKHNVPNFHLEKPDRIRITVGCIHDFQQRFPERVDIFDNPPEVDQRYVMAVHDAQYIKKLETSLPPEDADYETHLESDVNGLMVPVASHKDDEGDDDQIYDTFVSHGSMKAALRASGAVCAAVDAVSRGGYTRSFCAIRPPGHHAGRYGRTSDAPSQGYCLINNVAIGAKYASLTAGYTRIAIVDFDVHHGNGTQEILAGDDNFLFISIHVCDEKRYFYPGTGKDQGDYDESTGEYDGNILNIGLKRNTGSNIFLQQFTKKVIPRLEAYKPELIFLSAGFDGHKDDPTNGLKLTEEDYGIITKMIKTISFKYSRGRIISVLEGGYGIEKSASLQRCVNTHLRALIEDTDEEIQLASDCYLGELLNPNDIDTNTALNGRPGEEKPSNTKTVNQSTTSQGAVWISPGIIKDGIVDKVNSTIKAIGNNATQDYTVIAIPASSPPMSPSLEQIPKQSPPLQPIQTHTLPQTQPQTQIQTPQPKKVPITTYAPSPQRPQQPPQPTKVPITTYTPLPQRPQQPTPTKVPITTYTPLPQRPTPQHIQQPQQQQPQQQQPKVQRVIPVQAISISPVNSPTSGNKSPIVIKPTQTQPQQQPQQMRPPVLSPEQYQQYKNMETQQPTQYVQDLSLQPSPTLKPISTIVSSSPTQQSQQTNIPKKVIYLNNSNNNNNSSSSSNGNNAHSLTPQLQSPQQLGFAQNTAYYVKQVPNTTKYPYQS